MNRIKELREAAGIPSIAELARRLDYDRTKLSKLENGRARLTEDMARRLAEALGCHPGELIEPLPEAPRHEREAAALAARLHDHDPSALTEWLAIGRRLLPRSRT